jgi:hypothetical protein
MCLSIQIMGETLQERFLPTRPLARFHTPNSTRACINRVRGNQTQACTCERERLLIVYTCLHSQSTRCSKQTIIPTTPIIQHSLMYTTNLNNVRLRATRNVHMPNYAYPLSIPHGKSGGLTVPLAQPHSEIDL